MSDTSIQPPSTPIFKRCVRCDYSLRGLPANHACPECGLRFDEACGLYRPSNPKAAFFLILCMSGSSVGMIRGLRYWGAWATTTWAQKLWAIMGVFWFIFMAIMAWFLYRVYRRGQLVAVTTDGLIVRLVGFSEDLVPWTEIAEATPKTKPDDKRQIALVKLRNKSKTLTIGGTYNVFPKREDVERFVAQVNTRAAVTSRNDTGEPG